MFLKRIKSLFLDNNNTRQTIFKNTFWLSLSEVITRILGLFLFIYVANILGATEYGKFAFALSIVYLLNVFYGLTSSQIITREIAQDREKIKEISAIFSLKIILGLASLFLVIASSFFISQDLVVRKIILILAIYNLLNSFIEIIWAFFRARQKMEYEFLMKISQTILFVSLGFFVIFNYPSIVNFSYAYLFSTLVILLIFLVIFHIKIEPLKFSINKPIWKKILSLSWPLALVSIFSTIYNQTDSAMMGFWGQLTETGWYNASYKIIGVSLVPANLIALSFYPTISKAFKETKEKFQKLWDYFLGIMILLAVPLVIGGIVLAPKIINFVYDSSYFPSILSFQILIIMAGIVILSIAFQQMLIVINQQKKFFWVVLAGTVINIILNFILIPRLSLYGAGIATVITNLIIFIFLIIFSIKYVPVKVFNIKTLIIVLTAVISSYAMYFIIKYQPVYSLNIILSVLIGVIVYFLISAFILKFIFRFNFN
jgi:O-antigen/teichoic acid export membrane protein